MVQWIRLCAPNAGGWGSIPGQGTRSHMHAATKILSDVIIQGVSCVTLDLII